MNEELVCSISMFFLKTADTRLATEQRIRAFNQLRPLYAEYIKYARILLAGDQALEAIGIVVKRK
ncbi:MAG: hypothetical protein WC542_05450 [Paludibacter sp.]